MAFKTIISACLKGLEDDLWFYNKHYRSRSGLWFIFHPAVLILFLIWLARLPVMQWYNADVRRWPVRGLVKVWWHKRGKLNKYSTPWVFRVCECIVRVHSANTKWREQRLSVTCHLTAHLWVPTAVYAICFLHASDVMRAHFLKPEQQTLKSTHFTQDRPPHILQ